MKRFTFTHIFGFTIALTLIIGLLAACAEKEPREYTLKTPKNVKISVTGRVLTVTWDKVPKALGYEITTTSTGCGSGNKLINTKEITATNHTGTGNYLKGDGSSGAVQIKGLTTIEVTLMPTRDDNTKPMASAVSAKVKALGGKVKKDQYLDSEYSDPTDKTLSGM